jgi:hypothetical protein
MVKFADLMCREEKDGAFRESLEEGYNLEMFLGVLLE